MSELLAQIQHPSNVITGALTLVLAVRLLRTDSRARRLFGFALICVGIAAFTGGIFHGLELLASEWVLTLLWKATVQLIGVGSMLLALAAISVTVRAPRAGVILRYVVVLQFMTYAFWMLVHDDFRYVVYQYGLSMLLVLVLFMMTWSRHPEVARLVSAAIAVAVAAAVIQQSRIGLHEHFDHNDVYHVVQMLVMYLLYHGAMRL